MLFERFLDSHPVVALTTLTALTAACIYAAITAAPKPTGQTIVYIEDEDDLEEEEVILVVRS